MATLVVILIALPLVALALVALLVRLTWKVAEPNEALLVSGLGTGPAAIGDEKGFKIVVGKGVFVVPGLQKVRSLSLELHKAELVVECVTTQGIPVHVRGVVVYKVGDAFPEIANAARRFLDKENEMGSNVHEVFAGHLRQIVGAMTVEDMIRAREKLAAETRNSSAVEMEKLGLVIDSLQIQQVEDPTGYIENLAKPYQAAVEAEARIAAAERDREATEREQAAAALKAKSVADSEIEQARRKAAADTARAEGAQAGPLADAEARKAVVVQQTEVANLEAARTEKRLQTEVVKPAEAQRDARVASAEADKREVELRAEANARKVEIEAAANAKRVEMEAAAAATATERTGEAEARATRVRGEADASAIQAKLTAEAEGIEARAKALERNQEAVINTTIAEKLPEIVRAASESFRGIDHLVVLNGAEGMSGMMSQVMGAGLTVLPAMRKVFGQDGGVAPNGNRQAEPSRQERRTTDADDQARAT